MKEFEQNLTVGSVPERLFRFAVPLFFTNVLQSIYSIVDMIAVGRFVGSAGLAAVGNASMLVFIITGLGIGINIGGTVLIAYAKGASDRRAERETIGTLFLVSAAAAVLVTVAGLLASPSVFIWMKVPAEALPDACAYMRVLCWGTVFVFGFNAVCALLRGLGDSRRPLYFVLAAAVQNILLDLLFVGWLGIGTAGAAWATVISQGAALAIAAVSLRLSAFLFDFRLKSFLFKWEKAVGILKTGIPSALQIVVVNFSFLLVTGMFNRYGVAAAAAAGIGLKLSTFTAMPCWAAGQAVTAMAAQNLGAGKWKRTASVCRSGLWQSLLANGVVMIFIQLFAGELIRCFDSDGAVVELGVLYLRIFCSFSAFAYAAMYICNSFATGTGAAPLALLNALLESVVMRLLLCGLFGGWLGYGFAGICWGLAFAPFLPMLIGIWYFRCGGWRKRRL